MHSSGSFAFMDGQRRNCKQASLLATSGEAYILQGSKAACRKGALAASRAILSPDLPCLDSVLRVTCICEQCDSYASSPWLAEVLQLAPLAAALVLDQCIWRHRCLTLRHCQCQPLWCTVPGQVVAEQAQQLVEPFLRDPDWLKGLPAANRYPLIPLSSLHRSMQEKMR